MRQSFGATPMVFPTPVLMIGTYDDEGKPNLMNAAWGGVCSSDPPCVNVSVRKSRHTYAAISKLMAFTIGIASESSMKQADYVGIASGRDVDKFAAAGLTLVKSELVDAPYADEFPVILECRLLHVLEVGVHTQFVGQILDVKVDTSVLDEKGLPDIMKIKPLVFDVSRKEYRGVGSLLGKAFSVGRDLIRK